MMMLNLVVCGALLSVGLIHLLPSVGVLGSARLAGLYGLTLTDPNLLILMRHRAVLFGLLGVLLIVATVRPAWQLPALVSGLVSVGSYLWLYASVSGANSQLARVFTVDVVALVLLVVGLLAWLVRHLGVDAGSA